MENTLLIISIIAILVTGYVLFLKGENLVQI